MRATVLALVALGAISALTGMPAAAQPVDPGPFSFNTPSGYPFCMRSLYDDDDCSYRTYAQCAATASGIGLTCFANPALAYAQTYAPQQPRVKRKRNRNH